MSHTEIEMISFSIFDNTVETWETPATVEPDAWSRPMMPNVRSFRFVRIVLNEPFGPWPCRMTAATMQRSAKCANEANILRSQAVFNQQLSDDSGFKTRSNQTQFRCRVEGAGEDELPWNRSPGARAPRRGIPPRAGAELLRTGRPWPRGRPGRTGWGGSPGKSRRRSGRPPSRSPS